jgi:hypothetical protein
MVAVMYISFTGPLFVIAVGAILKYATSFSVSGVDMDTVGVILMVAGIAALLLSIGFALFNRDEVARERQAAADRDRRPPPPR